MKRILILLVSTGVAFYGFAQTSPLKYNVANDVFRTTDASLAMVVKSTKENLPTATKLDRKAKDSIDRRAKYGFYKDLANAFGKVGLQKEQVANTAYRDSLKALSIPPVATGIDIYNRQMGNYQAKLGSDLKEARKYLNEQKTFDYYYRTTGRVNNVFQRGGFIKDANDAQMFYNSEIANTKYSLLNNTSLSFGSDGSTASLYNELYADYFGPFRIGIGVLINNQSGSTSAKTGADSTKLQNDAVQKLLGGGGNGVFSISYPLLSYQDPTNQFNIKLYASPKVSADIPKIGTSTNNPAYNYDLGGEAGMYYSGVLGTITFYTHLRTGYVGGSTEFYNGLNKTDNKPFVLNQFSLGIAVTSVFRVSWNTYFGDGFVSSNFHNSLSVSISPN